MHTLKIHRETDENQFSLGKAALIAGLGLLIMAVAVPIAEFYISPKLLVGNRTETVNNIVNNKALFTLSIFLHFITLICDILVAWALYIFLRPVMKDLSLVTAWFRLLYTSMYLVALANLVKVLNLTNSSGIIETSQLSDNVAFYLNSFQFEWSFGLIIFGVYLLLLGYLVYKATYIPNIFGVLLFIAGFGYLFHTLGTFFAPDYDLDFLFFTFFGELILMLWLLIKGRKVDLNI